MSKKLYSFLMPYAHRKGWKETYVHFWEGAKKGIALRRLFPQMLRWVMLLSIIGFFRNKLKKCLILASFAFLDWCHSYSCENRCSLWKWTALSWTRNQCQSRSQTWLRTSYPVPSLEILLRVVERHIEAVVKFPPQYSLWNILYKSQSAKIFFSF